MLKVIQNMDAYIVDRGILNIILDPIFIFVFHMDVAGAAIATVISQFVSCVWVMKFLWGKQTTIKSKMNI